MLSRWDPTASPWNPSSPELEPGVIASSRLRVQGWNGDCYIPEQFMIKSTNWGRKSRRHTGNCIRVGECTIRQCFSRILFILRLWSCVNPFLNKWRSINTYDTLQRPSLVGISANLRNTLGLQEYSHLWESWAAELFPLYSETFDRNHFGSIAQTHGSVLYSLEKETIKITKNEKKEIAPACIIKFNKLRYVSSQNPTFVNVFQHDKPGIGTLTINLRTFIQQIWDFLILETTIAGFNGECVYNGFETKNI